MKVAITGHTGIVGNALYRYFFDAGHDVIGLSRTNGYDITNTQQIVDAVKDCDMFVNNAQQGSAQRELVEALSSEWDRSGKMILTISTIMAVQSYCTIPGMEDYRNEKIKLENTIRNLRELNTGVKYVIARPGVITSNNADDWVNTLMSIFKQSRSNGFGVHEISLGAL